MRALSSLPAARAAAGTASALAARAASAVPFAPARCAFLSPNLNLSRSLSANAFGSTLPEILQGAGWEGAWKHGVTPWDAGKAAPVVRHLLALRGAAGEGEEEEDEGKKNGGGEASSSFGGGPLPPGPVLVPGAGSGYDALEFARAGRRTVSVDIAPSAVEAGLKVARKDKDGPSLLASGLLEVKEGDFFAPELMSGPGPLPGERKQTRQSPWGVVFDYTFLCALPPDLRGAWARAMTTLVRPGCELVCLIFPIGDHKDGPPFAMQPTTIRDLLAEHAPGMWDELYLAPVPPSLSHGPRAGREWLGRYAPRTNRFPGIRVPGGGGIAARRERAAASKK
jgi:hypothetical protein